MGENKEYEAVDISSEILTEEEAQKLYNVEKEFIEDYVDSDNKDNVQEWLEDKLSRELPEKEESEIKDMSSEILSSIVVADEKKKELSASIVSGRDKYSWLASDIMKNTSHMSTQEASNYLRNLDSAVRTANAEMRLAVLTKKNTVNMNPNLDGYIAEQQHVNSFNLNAIAKKSEFRAEVLRPEAGEVYSANSVDVVIKDGMGKIAHRYQLKYGATAEATIRMINEGNYRGQQLVVPAEQVDAVQAAFPNRKVSSCISADNGTVFSDSLSKSEAKNAQNQTQNGLIVESDWSAYSNKDIAIGIAGEVGKASMLGVITGSGMSILQDIVQGDEVDAGKAAVIGIEAGADFGVKAAVAGGLKVAAERELISLIPKGTPPGQLASIAFVAVEDAKVLLEVASGDLTPKEGLEKIEQTTVACAAGIATGAEGAAIGAAIGMAFGPVGVVVGGLVGGTVGYSLGSGVGKAITKGFQFVRDAAVSIGKAVVSTAASIVGGAISAVGSAVSAIGDFLFGW